MTIKRPSRGDLRANKEVRVRKEPNHLSEKHFRNAFKPKSFNIGCLDETEYDQLGIVDDDQE